MVVKLVDLKVGEWAVSKSGGAWGCTADGVSSIDGIGGVGVLWYPSEFTVAEELFGPFRLLADPKPEPTTTGARTGRERVRDLIDGCGGIAAAAAAIRATEAALLAIALLKASGHNCGPMLDRIREACDA